MRKAAFNCSEFPNSSDGRIKEGKAGKELTISILETVRKGK